MELDDLPKEKLKQMIWQEINMLMEKNAQGKTWRLVKEKYTTTSL